MKKKIFELRRKLTLAELEIQTERYFTSPSDTIASAAGSRFPAFDVVITKAFDDLYDDLNGDHGETIELSLDSDQAHLVNLAISELLKGWGSAEITDNMVTLFNISKELKDFVGEEV